jgi:1-acyl-sn-glycerol-3-phosphate acyltransferase
MTDAKVISMDGDRPRNPGARSVLLGADRASGERARRRQRTTPLLGGPPVRSIENGVKEDVQEDAEEATVETVSPVGSATKRPAARKAPAKQAPVKQAPVKQAPVKQASAKRAATEQSPAEQATADQRPAKKAAAKRTPARQVEAEQSPPEQATADQRPAKKAAAKRTPAQQVEAEQSPATQADAQPSPDQQAPAKRAAAKQAADQSTAQQAPAKSAAADQSPTKQAEAERTSAKKAPAKRAAAKEAPAKEVAAEPSPSQQAPAKRAATKQAAADQSPAKEAAAKQAPAKEAAAEQRPAKRAAAKRGPAKQAAAQQSPAQSGPRIEPGPPVTKVPVKRVPVTGTPPADAPAAATTSAPSASAPPGAQTGTPTTKAAGRRSGRPTKRSTPRVVVVAPDPTEPTDSGTLGPAEHLETLEPELLESLEPAPEALVPPGDDAIPTGGRHSIALALVAQAGEALLEAVVSRARPGDIEAKVASVLGFLGRRLTGEYELDDFGFDAEFAEAVPLLLLRPLYRHWFRVEVRGIENLPRNSGALIVANHSGAIPIDALMTSVAVHEEHPDHRFLRTLGADLVFQTPFLAGLARRSGATLASNPDAERLLSDGHLVGVWPEGFKGIGKPFTERYKLQRFGRGGFVSAALRTGTPIVPCSIVGAEEIYPIIGNVPSLARLLGLPYLPITPFFPLLGPLGAIPLPSKWLIEFGAPVPTDEYEPGASEDPMLVFDLTDQIRQSIQQTLYSLLVQRRSIFF